MLPSTKTRKTTVIHLEVPTRKSQRSQKDALSLTEASGTTVIHLCVGGREVPRKCTQSPAAALAFKRVTSFLMLEFDQSGRSFAIAVVVFPAAIQPPTTSISCAFHAVPRPMKIDAKVEGPVNNLRIRWLNDQKNLPLTAPSAYAETLVIVFQLCQSSSFVTGCAC